MTFLPIVDRELRVRARLPRTYHARWRAVALTLLIALPMLLSSSAGGRPNGNVMFLWLTVLLFAFCLWEGTRQTFDCLSSERREGTLGLLFLTDLKGYDVVLGKLAGTSLSSLYGLISLLPILSLGLLAGGVTVGEFWRMVLVLLSTLFFSLGAGMWVSSRSRNEAKAMAATFLVLLGLAGGLPLLDFIIAGGSLGPDGGLALGSPGYACYLAFDQAYALAPGRFWSSLLVINILSLAFLAVSSATVGGNMQEEVVKESLWQRLQRPLGASHATAADRASLIDSTFRKTVWRERLLDRNPVFWLASRNPGPKVILWTLAGLLSIITIVQRSLGAPGNVALMMFNGCVTLLHLIFWFVLAIMASRFFVDTRRGGSLELLLSAPLQDEDFLSGQWLYLRRTTLGPLACLWLIQAISYFALLFSSSRHPQLNIGLLIQLGLQAFGIYLQWMAVCWVGLWFGLTAKKPRQAAIRTFIYVVVLPYLVCSGLPLFAGPARFLALKMYWFGFSLQGLIINWLFICWARNNVELGIRKTLSRHISGLPLFFSNDIKFEESFFAR